MALAVPLMMRNPNSCFPLLQQAVLPLQKPLTFFTADVVPGSLSQLRSGLLIWPWAEGRDRNAALRRLYATCPNQGSCTVKLRSTPLISQLLPKQFKLAGADTIRGQSLRFSPCCPCCAGTAVCRARVSAVREQRSWISVFCTVHHKWTWKSPERPL